MTSLKYLVFLSLFTFASVVCFAQRPELVVQTGHSVAVTSVAFSKDGTILASGGGSAVILWEVATGRELRALTGHSKDITSIALNGEGILASGSEDATVKLWDIATGRELRTLTGHPRGVQSVAFSADGRILASSSVDEKVKLWEVATGRELRTLTGHSVAFSGDGTILASDGGSVVMLWEVATGRKLRTLVGHSDRVKSVAFSVDGKMLATGSLDKTVKLWEITTGRELHTLSGHSDIVDSVAFSADGRTLASGSWDQTIKLWDVGSGKELKTLQGHSAWVLSVAFSADGFTLASGSWDHTIKLWDVTSGKELRTLRGHATWVLSVAFSGNGKTLATASAEPTIKLIDVANGQEWRRLLGHSADVNSVVFSPDGKTLASGSSDQTIKLWDVASGTELRTLSGHSAWISSVVFSGDGKTLASGGADYTIKLWDVASGRVLTTLQNYTGLYTRVALSADGKTLASGSSDKTIKLWEIPSGKELRILQGQSDWVSSVAFSPDGKTLASGSWNQTVKLWEADTGKELRTLQGSSDQVQSVVAFSADGKMLASGCRDGLKLWDVATGRELRTFIGHSNSVDSVAFSADAKFLVSGSFDGSSKIWETETGRLRASLVTLDESDWAVITPDGLFDASPGAQQLMHWMVGNEPVELEQLKARYYEPGLLTKILSGRPLPNVGKFEDPKLYPELKYEVPTRGSNTLTVTLINRGGGIGRVQLFVNGKEFLADARDRQLKQNPNVKQSTLNIDLSKASSKVTGRENQIRVVAWNLENYISSRGDEAIWLAGGQTNKAPPEVYAIIGGISSYAGSRLNLNFAAKDAVDIANAIELGAQRLFGAKKVHLTLLSTADDRRAIAPTKENFTKAFAAARQARPTDILIVYLAGHGITVQRGITLQRSSDTYCYLTQEARDTDTTALSDPTVLKRTTITSEELVEWIKEIPALKQAVMLDTCAAGAAQGQLKLMDKREASGDAIRAIDRAKDRTGSHILMGSAADAISYEASQYSHGLLTYALLKGMKGPALSNDEFVDISKLFRYAREEVEQLAKHIGGIQKPIIFAPNDESFEVGQLKIEDKQKIALAAPKEMILRPLFFDAQADDDTLGLMKSLRALLRDESFVMGRGASEGDLVFVDDEEFPGGIRPTGRYAVEGNQVTVVLRLRRDGIEIANAHVTATKDDLAAKVLEAVKAAIKKP